MGQKTDATHADLDEALSNGDMDAASGLLDTNPGLATETDTHGNPPLQRNLWLGIEAVGLLLSKGADPGQGDRQGRSPLHMAGSMDADALDLLLQAGADPNAADKSGVLPLPFHCFDECDPEKVSLLLKAGADPDSRWGAEMAPVHWAAAKGDLDVLRILAEAGADFRALNKYGQDAGELCVMKANGMGGSSVGDAAAVEFACSMGCDPDKALQKAMEASSLDPKRLPMAATLVSMGADPHARDKYGRTVIEASDPKTAAALTAAFEAREFSKMTAKPEASEAVKPKARRL